MAGSAVAHVVRLAEEVRSGHRLRVANAPDASGKPIEQIVPVDENKPFNMFHLLREVVDRDDPSRRPAPHAAHRFGQPVPHERGDFVGDEEVEAGLTGLGRPSGD